MDLLNLKPRQGSGTYRLGDSDDLVVMESIANVPTGKVCLKEHGIVVVCMEGMAQFEYDGAVVQLKKNDMFLYMANSVACNFMASPDFNPTFTELIGFSC